MKYFGASYYPEQMDSGENGGANQPVREAELRRDAQLMRAAGFNLVRMGEFAWSRMEPAAVRWDFDWLEAAVNTLGGLGIQSLLCTPTAAPPKWLMDRHPDIYPVGEDGRRREFGRRRHYCVNNDHYHAFTGRIVTALAERFKDNPRVIGYQLDNEFMAEQPHCYCATCRGKFQGWLQRKFGTIEELNRRWGTQFWSQAYGSFAEVEPPKPGHHPSARLDWQRFFSEAFVDYARGQRDILKGIAPGKLVTHNVCSSGFLDLLDLNQLGALLDVVGVDNYPFGWTLENEYGNAGDQEYHPAMASFALTMTRGWRRAAFWVTEAQTGRTFRPRQLVEPGRLRVWTHQEIAHGAEAVLWFHWRQFASGCEQLLQAILDSDGQPRRRYYEVQETIRELQAAAPEVAGARPLPEVAILRDFQVDWALEDGRTHPEFRYLRHLYLYYRALFEQHVNADVAAPGQDLHGYKLVLAPSLVLMDEAGAANLREYVAGGGTLVLTVQSGLRNPDNGLHRGRLPAYLTELCGVEIQEQNALKFADTTGLVPLGGGFGKTRYEGGLLFEILKLTTAQSLFEYSDRWFAGTPAVTVNRFGRGTLYYVATVPMGSLAGELLAHILAGCGVTPNVTGSSSLMVETIKTRKGNREFLHLINFTGERQTVGLRGDYETIGRRQKAAGNFELDPLGAVILQRV